MSFGNTKVTFRNTTKQRQIFTKDLWENDFTAVINALLICSGIYNDTINRYNTTLDNIAITCPGELISNNCKHVSAHNIIAKC